MNHSSDLALAGVIAKLQIRLWSGRKGDRQASRDTAERHNAAEGMVRVSKTLVPKAALEPLQKLATEARTYHYDHTIVWAEGAQFLPARLTIPYSTALQDFRLRFDQLATDFAYQYQDLVAAAPALLGQLYQEDDYPTATSIQGHFSLDVSYEPVPESGNFFANLASSTLDQYRRDLEAKNLRREKEMRRDLWERLHQPILKMAETLSNPDRIFRDSLVGNVQHIAEQIDLLNVFNDPRLTETAAAIRRTLSPLDPQELRHCEADRTAAAQTAQALADQIARNMQGYMSLSVLAAAA
jgi:hypothetical protein